MKKDYTEILMIIDESGSMNNLQKDVIGGFNTFVKDQKEVNIGTCNLTLVQFSTKFDVKYVSRPIAEVEKLTTRTYVPSGGTALYDTIAFSVEALGVRLRNMKEEERPDKVIVIIQTDGEENASIKYSRNEGGSKKIKAILEEQQNKYSWEVTFAGAKIDDVDTMAADLGIKACNTIKFADNSAGAENVFRSLSSNVASYRSGTKMDMSYESGDYANQTDAGVK